MAQTITYTCDRCHAEVEGGRKPVSTAVVTKALPVVHRVKLELCFECAEVLARFNREFLGEANG